MRDLQASTRTIATQQVAIMTALSFAEDLLAERRSTRALRREVRERARAILDALPPFPSTTGAPSGAAESGET